MCDILSALAQRSNHSRWRPSGPEILKNMTPATGGDSVIVVCPDRITHSDIIDLAQLFQPSILAPRNHFYEGPDEQNRCFQILTFMIKWREGFWKTGFEDLWESREVRP
jgi:hypothetical protein